MIILSARQILLIYFSIGSQTIFYHMTAGKSVQSNVGLYLCWVGDKIEMEERLFKGLWYYVGR